MRGPVEQAIRDARIAHVEAVLAVLDEARLAEVPWWVTFEMLEDELDTLFWTIGGGMAGPPLNCVKVNGIRASSYDRGDALVAALTHNAQARCDYLKAAA